MSRIYLDTEEGYRRMALVVNPAKEFPHYGTVKVRNTVDIKRVWLLLKDEEPASNFAPSHGYNAFLIDNMHDWNLIKTNEGPVIRIDSLNKHEPYWVLIEYKRIDII